MTQKFGVGIYHKGKVSGTLKAQWFLSTADKNVICTGHAVCIDDGVEDEYHGDYVVTYHDADGEDEATFDLEIRKQEMIYKLKWLLDDKIVSRGVGFETKEGLILSYINEEE